MSDLYVEQAGAGSPVVLLHEGIGDSRMWEPQWAAYAERFHVVRFDMRGFGQSPPAIGSFSLSGDLVELLDSLALGPAAAERGPDEHASEPGEAAHGGASVPPASTGADELARLRKDALLVVVILADADDSTTGYTTAWEECGYRPRSAS